MFSFTSNRFIFFILCMIIEKSRRQDVKTSRYGSDGEVGVGNTNLPSKIVRKRMFVRVQASRIKHDHVRYSVIKNRTTFG